MDYGLEFISNTLADWAQRHATDPEFIQPGKPTQNAYVEQFSRTYQDEVLNMYSSNICRKYAPSPKNGWTNTTKNDPMMHRAISHHWNIGQPTNRWKTLIETGPKR